MQVRRTVMVFFVFATFSTLVFGPAFGADGAEIQPVLGRAVPIESDDDEPVNSFSGEPVLGPIVLISANSDDAEDEEEPTRLSSSDNDGQVRLTYGAPTVPRLSVSVPVIGMPVPAPTSEPLRLATSPINEPLGLRQNHFALRHSGLALTPLQLVNELPDSHSSAPSSPHPDQIKLHLSEVARHLVSAGLPAEAAKIHEIQERLHRDHSQQLLIAFKESQVRALQAEIAALKQIQQTANDGRIVTVRTKILEILPSAIETLNETFVSTRQTSTIAERGTMSGTLDRKAGFELIDRLCQMGTAKIISQPALTVLEGRSGTVGQSQEIEPGCTIEHSLSATPTLLASGVLRLRMVCEFSKGTPPIEGNPNRRMHTRRLETVVELREGQSMYLVMAAPPVEQDGSGHSEKQSTLLIVVTPEVVDLAPSPAVFSQPHGHLN